MGDWKSKLMGELYSFKGNNSFSRDNLNYDQGTVKNIHYGDIHTKFSPLFDIYKENVPFINSEESIEKIDSENYCLEGDMVFADASEDLADVGKSIELINLNDERVLSGLHTILARQKNTDLIVGFGGHLFQSTSIRNQIRRESQGTKVLSLSATRLAKIQVFYPTRKDEQQKIADCLSSLDDLITLEAKKLEALKTHKKGLMQQLFPREGETVPRLRFPEFREAGKWEYYFGNKLFDQISNTNHNSDLPVLAITQEHGAIPRDMIDYHVSVTKKSLEVYKVVEVGDFIISLRSFQGGIEYSNHHGICSPAYVILRLKSQNVAHYFKYLFKTDRFISQLNKNIEGLRDGKMISYKQFSELRLPVSSFAEQQKIADCLSSLDDLITSQAQKVELLKRHKKGLIQRLFPVLDESQG
jgi:type I restriction enzyme S subunit